MDVQIVAAIIQGGCAIAATLIAALTAALIGKKFSDTQKLKEKLEIAQNDIAFLLAVEEEHCQLHKQNSGESNKLRVRDTIREQQGLTWSGKNTPGRIRNA